MPRNRQETTTVQLYLSGFVMDWIETTLSFFLCDGKLSGVAAKVEMISMAAPHPGLRHPYLKRPT